MTNKLVALAISAMLILSISSGSAMPKAGPLMGAVDGLRSELVDRIDVTGWACSFGVSDPVKITIFAGDPGSGSVALTSVSADQNSSSAVAKACGTNGAFRFVAPITSSQLHTYAGRVVFAIAASSSARLALKGPVTVLPADAGSVENVAGPPGFHLLVD